MHITCMRGFPPLQTWCHQAAKLHRGLSWGSKRLNTGQVGNRRLRWCNIMCMKQACIFMRRTYDGATAAVAFSGPLSSSDTHQPTRITMTLNLLSVIFCKPRTSSGVTTALVSRSSSVVTGTPTSAELQPFFTFIVAVCFGLPSVPPVSLPGLLPAAFLALDESWLLPLLVQE